METLFDAHFHIIDPGFPLIPNQGYLPEPFTVSDYKRKTEGLKVAGGAVVSGSFQGFDPSYLKAALLSLGPDFVGVTQIREDISDAEIMELKEYGIRAIRFNLKRGMVQGGEIFSLAHRVYEVAGWHSEFYLSNDQLEPLLPLLRQLPKISVDHLGLTWEGFKHLLSLVEGGARVKASGFGRVDLKVGPALREIYRVNPEALMFGTDLPCTRNPEPFSLQDIRVILENFDEAAQEKIFLENGRSFYGLTLPEK
ncbi:MAG: amidohydrolase family protein [bacterium]|nr:amidohydrolase family protein [bacterium]